MYFLILVMNSPLGSRGDEEEGQVVVLALARGMLVDDGDEDADDEDEDNVDCVPDWEGGESFESGQTEGAGTVAPDVGGKVVDGAADEEDDRLWWVIVESFEWSTSRKMSRV